MSKEMEQSDRGFFAKDFALQSSSRPSQKIKINKATRTACKTTRKAWSYERSPHGKDEWLTPPWLLEKLGDFDLDPCSPINLPWATAARHYSILDDGLTAPWTGRVWMNPPYSNVGPWMRRLVQHGNGIALIFARTETVMFFESVWDSADAVLFLRGRLKFHHVDGTPSAHSAGAPSCLLAYGLNNIKVLQSIGTLGKLIILSPSVLNAINLKDIQSFIPIPSNHLDVSKTQTTDRGGDREIYRTGDKV